MRRSEEKGCCGDGVMGFFPPRLFFSCQKDEQFHLLWLSVRGRCLWCTPAPFLINSTSQTESVRPLRQREGIRFCTTRYVISERTLRRKPPRSTRRLGAELMFIFGLYLFHIRFGFICVLNQLSTWDPLEPCKPLIFLFHINICVVRFIPLVPFAAYNNFLALLHQNIGRHWSAW